MISASTIRKVETRLAKLGEQDCGQKHGRDSTIQQYAKQHVKQLEEFMERFHRRSFMPCLFALLAACLLFAAPTMDPEAHSFAQAVDKQPSATAAKQDDRDPVFSGPQPGETIKPFKVLHIKSDDLAELEIAKPSEERCTLICFVHRLSNDDRILYGLGLVDFYVARHKELDSHFVILSDDRAKITKMLQAWARAPLFNKTTVSLSVDGVEGPGYYGLNRNVAMTVLVSKGNKVVHNFVFQAVNQRDLQTIMAAVAKTTGKPEPTLAKVQQELRAERQRRAEKRLKASPVFKLAPNEQLGRIMFGMVNARGNRIQNAKRRSQMMLEWAGDKKERKAALKKYSKAVLAGDFNLNQYSRTALRKLAED